MSINILSFNIFNYYGYGTRYSRFKCQTQTQAIEHNNLLIKMHEIIKKNNINIIFLQEDSEKKDDGGL
jgi:hypothetical protein